MRTFKSLSAAALLTMLPQAAVAQEPLLLDEIIVFGGVLPSASENTGATVEIVGNEELRTSGPSTAGLLATLPGLSLSANGGLGTTTSLRLRGLSQSYIGVLIDGIEVTDPSTTQTSFAFGTLMTSGIDRISVLKGAQSAVYGSEAIAGVVDIETWRPEEAGLSGQASVEAGSFETLRGSASVGYSDERSAFALTFSRTYTEGFSARDSEEETDGFEQTGINVFASYQLNDTVKLGFSGLWSDGTSEFDRSTTDSTGETDETRTGLRVFSEIDQGTLKHEFAASVYENDRFDDGGFTQRFVGNRTKAGYLGTATLSPDATLGIGADWAEEEAQLDAAVFSARTAAIFGELQYQASDAVDLSLTLRYDDHSEFGGQGSGRAAVAWRPTGDLIVRASVGAGYRAPSLFELFAPTFGNPNLTPEISRSAEIGLERQFANNGFVRATLFHIEIEDLIQYDFGTNSYQQVVGTTVTRGVEVSGEYSLSERVRLSGSYTYTDAKTQGDRLARVPRHDLVLGLDADITDRFSVGLQAQRVVDVLDGFGTLTPIDDYTVAEASASYKITDETEAYIRIENLTNEQYQTARGYNTSDRAFYAGLRTSF